MSFDAPADYDPTAGTEPASELWPEGNYEGTYVSHSCAPSQTKGTPGIAITFQVRDDKQVTVDCWITEATLAGMTGDQLAAMGWNGDYTKAEFDPPAVCKLYMKHDTYKGKTRERWNISANAKPITPAALQSVSRACDLWKARRAGSTPVPAAPPKAPPPAKPKPAAGGPPPRAPAKAPPKPAGTPAKPKEERLASTQDEAWDFWVNAGCDDGEKFWKAVEEIAPGKDPATLTAAEWSKVAAFDIPF